MAALVLTPKAPSEIAIRDFDFTPYLPEGVAINSCSATITTDLDDTGKDSNPSAMLSGAAYVIGNIIYQRLIGGLNGVNYIVYFNAVCSDATTQQQQATIFVETIKV